MSDHLRRPARGAAAAGAAFDDDRLVELLAAGPPLDPAALQSPRLQRAQERFLEWSARELSRTDRRGGGAAERALVDRLLVAALAARHGLRCVAGYPRQADEADDSDAQGAEAGASRAVGEARAPSYDLAVAAGGGRELWDQECDGWVALPEEMPSGRYVALKVRGDSMEPLMHDGDTVLVERGGTLGAEIGTDRLVVAMRPDEGYVVKSVGKISRRTVELRSLNPAYAPVTIPRDARLVVGVVVMRWCAHG